jgi:hypothetical protein
MNPSRVRHVSWWRVGLGLLVLIGGLSNLGLSNLDRRGVAPELMPSNETQWVGYYLATAAVIVAALLLVFAGVRHAWHRSPVEPDSNAQS